MAAGDGLGATRSPPPALHKPSGQAFWLRAQEEGHLAGVGAGPVTGQGKPWSVVRTYSLLQHEDADDEREGDQVSGDPHETILVRGLWTDGPRPASSHGRCTPGSRLRVHRQENLSPLGRCKGRPGGVGSVGLVCVHVFYSGIEYKEDLI